MPMPVPIPIPMSVPIPTSVPIDRSRGSTAHELLFRAFLEQELVPLAALAAALADGNAAPAGAVSLQLGLQSVG